MVVANRDVSVDALVHEDHPQPASVCHLPVGHGRIKAAGILPENPTLVSEAMESQDMIADLQEFKGVLLLTDREYEVFKAIGKGMNSSEISSVKGHKIVQNTVTKYYERIANKLSVSNWREIFRLAVRYDCLGLKRVPIIPPNPQYKLVGPNELEAAEIQSLPASRNGHTLLTARLTQTKGST